VSEDEGLVDFPEEFQEDDDVSLSPGVNADSYDEICQCLRQEVLERYDVYSYRHAVAILKSSFPAELLEIEDALIDFEITTLDIAKPGGNESDIPKKISSFLRPLNWFETRVQGDLVIRVTEHSEEFLNNGRTRKHKLAERDPVILKNHIDGHKIDYVKGRVALDMEWNSKDQTYDRDLYAFRLFHECGIISVAVLVTRSEKLNQVFAKIPARKKDGSVETTPDGRPKMCKGKYGASTTWMGKLLYRLNAGRHGGCPVLVFGIRPDVISDWPLEENSI